MGKDVVMEIDEIEIIQLEDCPNCGTQMKVVEEKDLMQFYCEDCGWWRNV